MSGHHLLRSNTKMSSIEVEEEEDDEFLNQLKQEELERQARKETKELPKGLTYTDDDGTVMEWDHDRKAYFPKVFIPSSTYNFCSQNNFY